MPKKTKKEKMLARKHRSTVLSSSAPTIPTPLVPEHSAVLFSLPTTSAQLAHTKQIAGSIEEFAAIKRDLFKTMIITFGIIATELLLSHYLPH